MEQVKRIIEPFVMRRVKEDVSSNSFNSLTDTSCSSKDWIGIDPRLSGIILISFSFSFQVLGNSLPEKHEHIVECDVPARQRIVYDETFSSCNRIIHQSGENKGTCITCKSFLSSR